MYTHNPQAAVLHAVQILSKKASIDTTCREGCRFSSPKFDAMVAQFAVVLLCYGTSFRSQWPFSTLNLQCPVRYAWSTDLWEWESLKLQFGQAPIATVP